MSFPSVTVCNLNKFRRSALRTNLPNVSKILENYRKKGKISWNGNGHEQRHLKDVYAQSGIKKSDNNIDDDVAPEDILNSMVLQASSEYSESQLRKTGYGFKNLITECRWMGAKCHEGYVYYFPFPSPFPLFPFPLLPFPFLFPSHPSVRLSVCLAIDCLLSNVNYIMSIIKGISVNTGHKFGTGNMEIAIFLILVWTPMEAALHH